MRRRELILTAGALAAAPRLAIAATPPLVVLELFTSQGCSSCPPADALLTELARHPDIVALTWHVDYWYNLSWRDPFVRPEWTARQRRYAEALRTDVYTPALTVSGTQMLVGSNRSAVRAAITAAPALPVPVSLQRSESGLTAQIGARPDAASVTLVVYDPVHATSVGGGENAGHILKESHIVRSATPVAAPAGPATLSLPPITADQGAVLLIQDRNLVVLGATQVRAAGEAVG